MSDAVMALGPLLLRDWEMDGPCEHRLRRESAVSVAALGIENLVDLKPAP